MCAGNRLVVLVTSYNNSKWCVKNIRSIFSQKHDNFFVIFRDDASADNTFEKVSKEIELLGVQNQIYLHKNSIRRGKAANIWLTLHQIDIDVSVDDSDIIVICDGDDWYPHEHVFECIDEIFSTKNIWVTYGGFKEYPSNKICWNKEVPRTVIKSNRFREFGKNSSQQRCFYAWLYRQIKLEDLMFKGRFAQTAGDVAKMMPMLEMASERHYFFKNSIYVYNRANAINDDKVDKLFQIQTCRSFLRERKKYNRLERQPLLHVCEKKLEIICFSEKMDDLCKEKFSNVNTIYHLSGAKLKENFIKRLEESEADFILLLSGREVFSTPINLKTVVKYLDKTQALRFDLLMNKDAGPKNSEFLGENVYTFQLMSGPARRRSLFYANVYSRKLLLEEIGKINFESIDELISKWHRIYFLNERFRVVLFFG